MLLLTGLVASTQTTGAYSGPWELEVSGTSAGLRGILAVGGGVVWSSGTSGTVLRSEDGGYEWQQCAVPPGGSKLDFRGVWAWDAQTALVLSSGPGDGSRLYKTTDGCNSWTLLFTNPDAGNAKFPGFWDGMLFLDRQHGLIYGDPALDDTRTLIIPLQVTGDGGSTWTRGWTRGKKLPALPGEGLFAASNSAMAAAEGWMWLGTSKGRVVRSQQSGDWQSAPVPLASGNDSSGVFSLAFRDRKHGVAVGGDYRNPNDATGTAGFTLDGGEHWSAARKPPHGYRSAVAWDTKDQAWITAGTNGSDVSYDDGNTWQWLDSGNWNALGLPWAVGPNGQIGKLGTLPAKAKAGASVSR
jgi:photosystem II stability/assembly factor-like uncharacterized protein